MRPTDERFPRGARLRRSRDFQRVARRGRRRVSRAFTVLGMPGGGARHSLSESRLGVTVSRRVGNAVVRNRVKRCVREWFRRAAWLRAGGVDIVVIARSEAVGLSGRGVHGDLDGLCRGLVRRPM